jgi:hypothetical protein
MHTRFDGTRERDVTGAAKLQLLFGIQFSRVENPLRGVLDVARLNGGNMFSTRAMTTFTGDSGNKLVKRHV